MLKLPKPEGLVLVSVALVLLFAITNWFTGLYRQQRLHRAEQHFRSGENFARTGRPEQAAEEYRAALTFSRDNSRYQLALARSLMDLGRLDEAESHLLGLLETDPNNALVYLMLARISAREGRLDEAMAQYNQAIYGLWPSDATKNRLQTRFELVDVLARKGHQTQALAELLALADEAPDKPDVQIRIGDLLLQHGSPQRASEVFAKVLQINPRDAAATLGRAQASFAEANYIDAENWYRKALRLDPEDQQARRRLEETLDIQSLDPTLVSLSASMRFQRSRALIERTLVSLQACTANPPAGASVQSLISSGEEFLKARQRHREGDTPKAIMLAEEIWQARKQACGRPPADEEELDLVMAKVTK